MSPSRVLIFILGTCAAAACGGGNVTGPSEPGISFTGEWSGTTPQGASIAFSVSANQTVTSITVGYRFNGCSGTNTFSNLSLDIGQSGFPPRVPTQSNPGFGYGSGSPEAPNYTQVLGTFTSGQTATGSVTFLNFTNCGNAVTNWSATKR